MTLLLSVLAAGCGTASDGDGSAPGEAAEDPVGEGTPGETAMLSRTTPDTPAGVLLSRALEHHDPEAAWSRRPIRLEWASLRPDGSGYTTALHIDDAAGRFDLEMERGGYHLEYGVQDGELDVRVDGSREIGDEARQVLSLDREGGLMWRNYYHFLAGLPMKLTDPGTILEPGVDTTTFQGREVLALHAVYETDDGYPYWEFYFEPRSAALVGARFWREARDADGEYLIMEGVAESEGLRIPARRMWYMNDDDEYLGTDEVRGLSVGR